jgi:hypothetical protein
MWLGVTDIKKEIKSTLNPYYNSLGFRFRSGFNGGAIGFMENSKKDYYFMFFGVFTTGRVLANPMFGYLDSVERILFKVKLPMMSEDHYRGSYNSINHLSITENNNYKERIQSETLYNSKEVKVFCDKIIEYMETKGLTFMKRNNSLEKVYNQIIHNWKYKNLDPISEHQDNYFKALIILKLMKDPNIEDYKAQFREKLLAYRNPEDWLHSFKNLCDLLDSPDFEKEYLI